MSALVIFSLNVHRVAAFYESVLGATPFVEESGDIRLVTDREEVLVHFLPDAIAATIQLSEPPAPRSESPLKPIFDVGSLEAALDHVRATGGVVTDRAFSVGGLARHDVLDPDGNVIQLQAPTS